MTATFVVAQTWVCPNGCGQSYTSDRILPNRFHVCPKLRMMTAPLVPEGISAKVELHEREDYVGRERVQVDPEQGRPVMSVVTTRDDGQDVMVFAPTASGRDAR